jgi:hypothetical protein
LSPAVKAKKFERKTFKSLKSLDSPTVKKNENAKKSPLRKIGTFETLNIKQAETEIAEGTV